MIKSISLILLISIMLACSNPFAPSLDFGDREDTFLGDQKTIEGIFQNWRYAYNFKDTLIYGRLIHSDFIFEYMDYSDQIKKTWNRENDLYSTSNLFDNSSYIDLTWNGEIAKFEDSLSAEAFRSFFLQISFPDEIIRLYGRANISLERKSANDDWKIIRWVDESNY